MENESNPLMDLIQNFINSSNTETADIHKNSNNNQNSNINIMDMLNNIGNFTQNSHINNKDSNFDISNMIKIQKIISALSAEDSRKDLLTTIKPFLRKSRQAKIDEYMAYLSVITAIGAFNDKKE